MLFRPEALSARSDAALGAIRIRQPFAYRVWALIALAMLGSIISFLAFATVTQRATVAGVLMPAGDIANLASPLGGTVIEARAQDGARVAAGQVLFVLSTERQQVVADGAAGTQAAIAAQLATRQLLADQDLRRAEERSEARERSIAERLAVLERELIAIERERELAASRLQLAENQAHRINELARSGFVSAGQQATQQDELLAARQAAQALERSRIAIERERASLRGQLRDAQNARETELAEARKARALLAQESTENAARATHVVTAPYAGTVMQDDALLAGSLAENIAFFDTHPKQERVEAAAQLAAIHSEIAEMPMGYQTLVDDMGSSLSGGQKQRVLLARALQGPKILALDEATSHLDVDSERAVNAAIKSMRLTRITIAHRPETIANARRVVALAGGKVVRDMAVAAAAHGRGHHPVSGLPIRA